MDELETNLFATVELSDPRFERDGLRAVTVASPALGGRADCTVWAPATGGPTPLVVLLHGVYGSHWAWAQKAGAHRIAAELIDSGEAGPFALAMPSDGLGGLGSGYVDRRGAAVASWIIDEVPVLASLALRGVDPAAPIALIGLSMGGFGALRLGAANGHRVVAAAGLSSITHLTQMDLFGAPMVRRGVLAGQDSVIEAAREHRHALPRLHIDCGRDDLLIEPNRELHRQLVAELIPHEWAEHEGRHEWAYWERHLPAALRFATSAFAR